MHTQTFHRRHLAVPALALAAALGLGACGPGATAASQSGGGTTAPPTGRGGGAGGGTGSGRGFPGVGGLVADVTGSTAQVQSTTSQTAVTWTRSTRFSSLTPTSASAVHVGDCVTARPAFTGRPSGTATATPVPTATTAGATTMVAAATVELFPASSGQCLPTGLGGAGGGAGGFGGTGGGRGGASGTGTPTGGPGGQNGFRGGAGRGTIGTVASVASGSFVVRPVVLRGPNGPAGTPLAPVTVTWDSATTFTRLQAAAATAVKVGVCVTAIGKTDSTGALTAMSMQVSQPVGGSCTTGRGFGGRGGFGGGTGTGAGRTGATSG